jgi:hypothetical protein
MEIILAIFNFFLVSIKRLSIKLIKVLLNIIKKKRMKIIRARK